MQRCPSQGTSSYCPDFEDCANDPRKQAVKWNANWQYFLVLDPKQDLANYSELDERAAYFYAALYVTAGTRSQKPGVGQAYLGSLRDKDGHAFDGAQTYRLHVPPNPPAKQFWSVTLYDTDTRALIQNKEQRSDRSSREDIVKNPDGSVDSSRQPRRRVWSKTGSPPCPAGRGLRVSDSTGR